MTAESLLDYNVSVSGHHGGYHSSVFSFSGDPVRTERIGRSCFLLPERWLFVLSDSADDVHFICDEVMEIKRCNLKL